MLIGTHSIERGPSTLFQKDLSRTMQKMWVDFARDPETELAAKWDWQAVDTRNKAPMVLGKDGVLMQQAGGRKQVMVMNAAAHKHTGSAIEGEMAREKAPIVSEVKEKASGGSKLRVIVRKMLK